MTSPIERNEEQCSITNHGFLGEESLLQHYQYGGSSVAAGASSQCPRMTGNEAAQLLSRPPGYSWPDYSNAVSVAAATLPLKQQDGAATPHSQQDGSRLLTISHTAVPSFQEFQLQQQLAASAGAQQQLHPEGVHAHDVKRAASPIDVKPPVVDDEIEILFPPPSQSTSTSRRRRNDRPHAPVVTFDPSTFFTSLTTFMQQHGLEIQSKQPAAAVPSMAFSPPATVTQVSSLEAQMLLSFSTLNENQKKQFFEAINNAREGGATSMASAPILSATPVVANPQQQTTPSAAPLSINSCVDAEIQSKMAEFSSFFEEQKRAISELLKIASDATRAPLEQSLSPSRPNCRKHGGTMRKLKKKEKALAPVNKEKQPCDSDEGYRLAWEHRRARDARAAARATRATLME